MSSPLTLCPKLFTLDAQLVVFAVSPWEGEKKLKKIGVEKNSSRGGEKNTLLKKLPSALACGFFKSVFFCGWAFCFMLLATFIFTNKY